MAKPPVTIEDPTAESTQTSIQVSGRGAANQQTLRNIGLIIGREYKNRVQQRSFIISTIIILVLLVIAACIPTIIEFITSRSNSQTTFTVVNEAGPVGGLTGSALTRYIAADLNGSAQQAAGSSSTAQSTLAKPHFVISDASPAGASALQTKVKNGDLNILLVITRDSAKNLHFTYYANGSASDDNNLSQVQSLASQLSFSDRAGHLGLTATQASSLFTPPGFTRIDTQPQARSTGDELAGYFIAYAGVVLILMSVFLYGMGVATGVAEEKGSRIMEILVNATTPFQLMAGKIIGIGAAGLTQMVCIVIVGIAALLAQAPLQQALLGTSAGSGLSINITGVSISLLLLVLLYFVLGFLLYSTLFAAVGALVKRQDEVQSAVQPITWLFMIGYIISLATGSFSGNALWMKIISYIPFWTPTLMLMRIGTGNAAPWEILLSVVIMLVAIVLCAILSARVYRFGVLMYGQKPKFGQLLKVVGSNQ